MSEADSKKSCSEREFKEMVAHIRNVAPPPQRTTVNVKRLPKSQMEGHYGWAERKRNTFDVVISSDLTPLECEETLIHEWAHVLAWRPLHPLNGHHGPEWGIWYAKIYSKYHGIE